MKLSDFQVKVYDKLSEVPKGKVTTYQDLAHALNCKAYQAIGRAMNKNPYIPDVPCHRVINANGYIGGYAKGITQKRTILLAEGIEIIDNQIDLKRYRHHFK